MNLKSILTSIKRIKKTATVRHSIRIHMNRHEALYRAEIDKYLKCGPENIFFYWKGRVALYALLKAMGVGPSDEVIVQGYTCVVVANAILYLGATPIYVDINLDTYNMDLDQLGQKINERTKVIICQNTYGLSSNLEEIIRIAKERSNTYEKTIYTLEDCTHGFGGQYHGKPNGFFCDASFFSTQWSKPYTTGVGGFCVIHNDDIKQKMLLLNADLIQPGAKERLELKLMYFVRQYIINDITYWPMIRLYRWLSRKNLVVGSSSGEEVSGVEMPEGFYKAQSIVQYKKGLKSIRKLEAINQTRKKNAATYTGYLKSIGKKYVNETFFDDHIFIRYPLLVDDRDRFRELAEKAKITLGEWFESPIYPAYNDLSVWKMDTKAVPNAMYVCEHMVNLPTEIKDPDKVIRFLEGHKEMIR